MTIHGTVSEPSSGSAPRTANGFAIAALCCGLFPVTCALGVVFGSIGLHQLRLRLDQHGAWMALVGIAAGVSWFALVLTVPEFAEVADRGPSNHAPRRSAAAAPTASVGDRNGR